MATLRMKWLEKKTVEERAAPALGLCVTVEDAAAPASGEAAEGVGCVPAATTGVEGAVSGAAAADGGVHAGLGLGAAAAPPPAFERGAVVDVAAWPPPATAASGLPDAAEAGGVGGHAAGAGEEDTPMSSAMLSHKRFISARRCSSSASIRPSLTFPSVMAKTVMSGSAETVTVKSRQRLLSTVPPNSGRTCCS